MELKIKIWDTQENKWFVPVYEAYRGELSELLVNLSGDLVHRTMNGVAHESTFPNRYIKVLFTGLLCHGNEVYEGDLLQRNSSTGKGTVIGEVHFKEGEFRIKWHPEKNGWNDTLHIHLNDCEHIGNIYENENLLK